jgi:quercetin dioxygenase-like cupin family protein
VAGFRYRRLLDLISALKIRILNHMVNRALRAAVGMSFFVSTALLAAQSPGAGGNQTGKPVPTAAWAPKPTKTAVYTPPQKPWVKLSELKAKHKGEATWREMVVDDGRLTGEFYFAAAGTKVGRRFHPDTREWFAVVEGEVRVEIEGHAPFTATRGSLVNIPRQTIYALETIGDAPSLRFAVNVARAKTLYPQDVQPPPPAAGTQWVPVTINRSGGRYDEFNQPHLNVHAAAASNPKYSGGRFVRDDKSEMLVLYGHERNLPPLDPKDKGHFHAESAEFWLVFSGQIRYALEGQEPFVASEGDVVYVPANTWHATRYIGDNSCRLSITEYVGNALLLDRPQP